eukprot:5745659-Pleurochrysis_carterae.AAC.2
MEAHRDISAKPTKRVSHKAPTENMLPRSFRRLQSERACLRRPAERKTDSLNLGDENRAALT